MKVSYIIIEPSGRTMLESTELPEPDDKAFLSALRKLVESITGPHMEHVNIYHDFGGGSDFRYLDMFVNDMGRLTGLPRNEPATAIYRRNWLMHAADPGNPEHIDWIAGPAVIFREKVWR